MDTWKEEVQWIIHVFALDQVKVDLFDRMKMRPGDEWKGYSKIKDTRSCLLDRSDNFDWEIDTNMWNSRDS